VLTRQDFLQLGDARCALAAIVQTQFITKHVLFVGFSLSDDTVHQIAHEVRKVLPDRADPDHAPRIGTAPTFRPKPLVAELLQPDIRCIAIGPEPTTSPQETARRLEVILDLLLAEAMTTTGYLLDAEFAGTLAPDEAALAQRLRAWVADVPPDELKCLPAWSVVEGALQQLGIPQ
jgi:hypothetical protein